MSGTRKLKITCWLVWEQKNIFIAKKLLILTSPSLNRRRPSGPNPPGCCLTLALARWRGCCLHCLPDSFSPPVSVWAQWENSAVEPPVQSGQMLSMYVVFGLPRLLLCSIFPCIMSLVRGHLLLVVCP